MSWFLRAENKYECPNRWLKQDEDEIGVRDAWRARGNLRCFIESFTKSRRPWWCIKILCITLSLLKKLVKKVRLVFSPMSPFHRALGCVADWVAISFSYQIQVYRKQGLGNHKIAERVRMTRAEILVTYVLIFYLHTSWHPPCPPNDRRLYYSQRHTLHL